ncbi:TPA: hypothetical protein QDA71_002488 [Burkholderia vietnamiensis]|uniref:hypothetical protein n=1 Tax=Burkholderia sp. LMG 13014 TaxID=2709306 RepID=UPI001963D963|nr:hypothetical protein [Burkholderia sp. LMG 13014]HDR8945495.1 hypothetical protein [Burkholderia vietnamiensis]HDR9206728.1 hypothetical protein [Burkholderia vietnamiensis]
MNNPPVSILSLWGVWFAITLQCVGIAFLLCDASPVIELVLMSVSLVLITAGVWPVLTQASADEWNESWTGN